MGAPALASSLLQETFNLKEGPVTLSFPATFSADSYEDLADQLGLVLKRLKRRVASDGGGNEDI
jgi:hypothetical protein